MHDDPWSGRQSVVNEDLVRAVEEKIRETEDSPLRTSTISPYSTNRWVFITDSVFTARYEIN